jgi:hypothetical protein
MLLDKIILNIRFGIFVQYIADGQAETFKIKIFSFKYLFNFYFLLDTLRLTHIIIKFNYIVFQVNSLLV